MEIIAHRGSVTDDIKENTLPAFERAKSLDADGIETDVRLTKDNDVILFHDTSIGKKLVRKLTKKDLESRVGYQVPTLTELLDWADDDFLLNLELKEHDCVSEVYEILKEYKNKNIVLTSFHHPTAFKLSKVTKHKCGLLMPIRPVYLKPFLQLIPADLEYIVWDYNVYDIEFRVQLASYKHLVYNMGEIRPTKKDFVDGIISDHLDVHVRRKAS